MPYRKPISYLIRVQNIIQGKVSSPFIIRGALVSLALLASHWSDALSSEPLIGWCESPWIIWLLFVKSDFLNLVLYKHLSNKKRGLPALYSISPARRFNEKSLINNSFFKDTNPKSSILKNSPAARILCCLFHILITLCKCLV